MGAEKCTNCGGFIGEKEQAYLFDGNVVCTKCHNKLSRSPGYKPPRKTVSPDIAFIIIFALCLAGLIWGLFAISEGDPLGLFLVVIFGVGLAIILFVALVRWVFRIDTQIQLLTEIRNELKDRD